MEIRTRQQAAKVSRIALMIPIGIGIIAAVVFGSIELAVVLGVAGVLAWVISADRRPTHGSAPSTPHDPQDRQDPQDPHPRDNPL